MGSAQQSVEISHYTYRVSWSPEDGEYVGTCLELPSLSWLAVTQVEAVSGIQELVRAVVDDLSKSAEPLPIPLVDAHYSGRFNIRISPDLHRELKLHATERGMSLNRYVSDLLAHH